MANRANITYKTQTQQMEQIQEETTLGADFYNKIIKLENQYRINPSQQIVEDLIKMYSDCIHYFQQNSQAVSIYFQHKMKRLLLNKRKIDKEIKIVEKLQQNISNKSNVEKLVIEHKDSIGKYQNKVTSIIDMQKQILAERRLCKQKQMTKTSAFTMSMDSLFESPNKSNGKAYSFNKTKLFEKLIDDDQDNLSQNLQN